MTLDSVEIRFDQKRGCGYRKEGGLYMISGGVSAPCGLLPIPLTTCPTCSCGIKPSRGWTWVDIKTLRGDKVCELDSGSVHHSINDCLSCPLNPSAVMGTRQGLLWVGGGSFYKRPSDWTEEAIKQGVSRRISAVPKDFKIGETWVLVAHREAIQIQQAIVLDGEPQEAQYQAAIFHAFKPTAIEYVVKGDETEEDLDRLVKRGITPVKVVRQGEQQDFTDLDNTPEDEGVLVEQ